MSAVQLSIIGAGSLRCSVPVIIALSTFFGERALEITMFDADEERLDLFDRFARHCFTMAENTHSLKSTADLTEALERPDKVIVQLDENCARKMIAQQSTADPLGKAVDRIRELLPAETGVFNLIGPSIFSNEDRPPSGWPPEISEYQQVSIPFDILRILNGEDYPYELFRTQQHPLGPWLNLPVLR